MAQRMYQRGRFKTHGHGTLVGGAATVPILGATGSLAAAGGDWPPSGFPDSTNTGYRNHPDYEGTLTPFTGTITSNTTYSQRSFSGGVTINSGVTNVHFEGCRFWQSGTGQDGWPPNVYVLGSDIYFNYCTIEPTDGAPDWPTYPSVVTAADSYQYGIHAQQGGRVEMTNCDFWGFGNASTITESTQSDPKVWRDCWFHIAADIIEELNPPYHHDGPGQLDNATGLSYIVIDHCNIESYGNTNAIAMQNGSYDHMTITNNLVGGFGYTVSVGTAGGQATNLTFTDNVFTCRLEPVNGPLHTAPTGTGLVWARNKWWVPNGSEWGDANHDGWYWLPVSGYKSGQRDDRNDVNALYVSETDYTG